MAFTPEQLEERKTYCGGTDCAPIMGMSKYRSCLEVWTEKCGIIEPEDISQKAQVRFGIKMEPVLAEMWMEDTGKELHRKNETIRHPKYKFLGANIDRRVVGEKAGWEAKYFSPFRINEFANNEIPADCLLQIHHYLAVTGWDRWYLMAALGNGDPIKLTIERDDDISKQIIDKEVYFWKNFVEPKIMPDTITAQDDEILLKLYPQAVEGQTVQLTDDANRIIESITALTADKKTIENELKKLQNTLKSFVKENEIGTTGIYTVKWTNIHKDSYTVQASDYRMLKYRKIEEKEN